MISRLGKILLPMLLPVLSGGLAHAGEADVIGVSVEKQASGTYRFDVTVRHADDGWNHYADGWEVATESGERLGYRALHHPHVDEQPFTRSLSGVTIPDSVETVVVRAHDNVHDWGGAEFVVTVPR